jgi:hypothetical protein
MTIDVPLGYCEHCGRPYHAEDDHCPDCGDVTELEHFEVLADEYYSEDYLRLLKMLWW